MIEAKDEIFNIVNKAIDDAVKTEKYQLNLYNFIKGENMKRKDVQIFLNSNLVSQMKDEVAHLDLYLDGGPEVADLREVYGWMGKPRARKFKEYLLKMIDDVERYEKERRPGRKPGSKSKKKKSGDTNK
jgi:hypothetical protein